MHSRNTVRWQCKVHLLKGDQGDVHGSSRGLAGGLRDRRPSSRVGWIKYAGQKTSDISAMSYQEDKLPSRLRS